MAAKKAAEVGDKTDEELERAVDAMPWCHLVAPKPILRRNSLRLQYEQQGIVSHWLAVKHISCGRNIERWHKKQYSLWESAKTH